MQAERASRLGAGQGFETGRHIAAREQARQFGNVAGGPGIRAFCGVGDIQFEAIEHAAETFDVVDPVA